MAEERREVTRRLDKLKKLFSAQRGVDVNHEETGLDRVKSLFRVRYGEPLSEEVKDLPVIVFVATCVGFAFGGMLGSRHAGDKFIALNHHAKFTSTMQAQREMHSAAILGFVRQGCKWGWKIGLFAGVFSGIAVLIRAYRDKDDSINYMGAGGITGGIYRLRWGLMPTIGGSVLGLLIREQKLDATSVLIDDIATEGESDGLKTYYNLPSKTDAAINGDMDSNSSGVQDTTVTVSDTKTSGKTDK